MCPAIPDVPSVPEVIRGEEEEFEYDYDDQEEMSEEDAVSQPIAPSAPFAMPPKSQKAPPLQPLVPKPFEKPAPQVKPPPPAQVTSAVQKPSIWSTNFPTTTTNTAPVSTFTFGGPKPTTRPEFMTSQPQTQPQTQVWVQPVMPQRPVMPQHVEQPVVKPVIAVTNIQETKQFNVEPRIPNMPTAPVQTNDEERIRLQRKREQDIADEQLKRKKEQEAITIAEQERESLIIIQKEQAASAKRTALIRRADVVYRASQMITRVLLRQCLRSWRSTARYLAVIRKVRDIIVCL